jgi:ubiquitin-protein ligase
MVLLIPGIKGQPLDSSEYHWQASITGPAGSPYEGGIFFLYLKVPFTYPFDPPEVRGGIHQSLLSFDS